MPHPTCGACKHAEREAIDIALKSGAPMRAVAKQYGLSLSVVFQHAHHDEPEKTSTNTGQLKRIDQEIVRLHAAQNRAKRKKNSTEVLAISRELRNWFSLRVKAEAVAGAQRSTQDASISPAEALSLARAVIESHLSDPETTSWLRALLDRVPAAPEVRAPGSVPEGQE